MDTIEYMRQSGRPITVSDNEANRAYAESMGWVLDKPKAKAKAKRKAK